MDQDIRSLIDRRIQGFLDVLAQLDPASKEELAAASRLLIDCLRGGHAIYMCGNGGSAADAQHIAGELAGRFLRDRRALPCLALSVDTSILTAIGNDFGFDQVFARQVEAYVRQGDVIWCLSTSGNSPNLLAAASSARALDASVLGFTGRGGGALGPLCDVCFHAPAETSYEIQQVHQLGYHILCEAVEVACCDER